MKEQQSQKKNKEKNEKDTETDVNRKRRPSLDLATALSFASALGFGKGEKKKIDISDKKKTSEEAREQAIDSTKSEHTVLRSRLKNFEVGKMGKDVKDNTRIDPKHQKPKTRDIEGPIAREHSSDTKELLTMQSSVSEESTQSAIMDDAMDKESKRRKDALLDALRTVEPPKQPLKRSKSKLRLSSKDVDLQDDTSRTVTVAKSDSSKSAGGSDEENENAAKTAQIKRQRSKRRDLSFLDEMASKSISRKSSGASAVPDDLTIQDIDETLQGAGETEKDYLAKKTQPKLQKGKRKTKGSSDVSVQQEPDIPVLDSAAPSTSTTDTSSSEAKRVSDKPRRDDPKILTDEGPGIGDENAAKKALPKSPKAKRKVKDKNEKDTTAETSTYVFLAGIAMLTKETESAKYVDPQYSEQAETELENGVSRQLKSPKTKRKPKESDDSYRQAISEPPLEVASKSSSPLDTTTETKKQILKPETHSDADKLSQASKPTAENLAAKDDSVVLKAESFPKGTEHSTSGTNFDNKKRRKLQRSKSKELLCQIDANKASSDASTVKPDPIPKESVSRSASFGKPETRKQNPDQQNKRRNSVDSKNQRVQQTGDMHGSSSSVPTIHSLRANDAALDDVKTSNTESTLKKDNEDTNDIEGKKQLKKPKPRFKDRSRENGAELGIDDEDLGARILLWKRTKIKRRELKANDDKKGASGRRHSTGQASEKEAEQPPTQPDDDKTLCRNNKSSKIKSDSTPDLPSENESLESRALIVGGLNVPYEIVLAEKNKGAAIKVKTAAKSKHWKRYKCLNLEMLEDYIIRETQRNHYGGRLDASGKSTGFFHVKKIADRWTIIDPDGNYFFSAGVNGVSPLNDAGAQEVGFAAEYESTKDWATETHDYLFSQLGFNTLGCWSHPKFFKDVNVNLPYCPCWNFMTAYCSVRLHGQVKISEGPLPCFDKEFETFCNHHAKGLVETCNDPWLLGHFSDDEMPFKENDIVNRYLGLPDTDPGHQAALRWLSQRKKKTQDISENDHAEFCTYVISRYFQIVSSAMKKYDPNHMFLGTRFHGPVFKQDSAFVACSQWVDVVSINYYQRFTPEQERLNHWSKLSGRPLIVTEWCAKSDDATDCDNVAGAGLIVPTQKNRGAFYENFAIGLLRNPNVVGWHWFRYLDKQNSNMGILDSNFRPYGPLTTSMHQINTKLYSLSDYLLTASSPHFMDEPVPLD
ncbi:hypothetical protein ACA910_019997 [Epithemia clementina (nom. ined.)]